MIIALAARQHGVVARGQLVQAGVTPDLVDHRLRAGRLRRLHRGVYLVGPLMVPKAREMAAVLACGDGAAVMRRSAAVLWQLGRGEDGDGVEVVVTRGRTGRIPGIRVRHMQSLEPDEITVRDGIRITTPARTLYDLAGVLAQREIERALAEAFALRLVHRSSILALLDRHARRPGASRLRDLLAGDTRLNLTRSEAEERLLTLVRKAQLPTPAANVKVAGYEVDSSGERNDSWLKWMAARSTPPIDTSKTTAAAMQYSLRPVCASCA